MSEKVLTWWGFSAFLIRFAVSFSISFSNHANTLQKCMISGTPQSQIWWLKDGQPLRTGSRVRLLSKDHIRVTSVSKDDQGMFQCFVKNDIDVAQGMAEISLGEVAPQLHYRFIEQTLQPGPGVSLKCTATGSPTPQIMVSRVCQ